MSDRLNILKKQHQKILDYEVSRERRLGARDQKGILEVRGIANAHLELWKSAGGNSEDFMLAGFLENRPLQGKGKGQTAKEQ